MQIVIAVLIHSSRIGLQDQIRTGGCHRATAVGADDLSAGKIHIAHQITDIHTIVNASRCTKPQGCSACKAAVNFKIRRACGIKIEFVYNRISGQVYFRSGCLYQNAICSSFLRLCFTCNDLSTGNVQCTVGIKCNRRTASIRITADSVARILSQCTLAGIHDTTVDIHRSAVDRNDTALSNIYLFTADLAQCSTVEIDNGASITIDQAATG